MKKRRIAALAIVFLLLCGCSEGFLDYGIPVLPATPSPSPTPTPTPIELPVAKPRSSLFAIAWTPVPQLQPLRDSWRYNDDLSRLIYESLFMPAENFTFETCLAKSITRVDDRTYTVSLRGGVQFSDGSELTADDVVYSLNLARGSSRPYAERLGCVSGVTVIDSLTVEITLSTPVTGLEALLDVPVIKEESEKLAAAIGTGPYRFEYINTEQTDESSGYEGHEAVLLANDLWWQNKAQPVRRIDLLPCETLDELVYWLQSGYLSIAPIEPLGSLSPGAGTTYEKWQYVSGIFQYIGINTARSPLDNASVRYALAMAFDREGLTSDIFGSYATHAYITAPEGSGMYHSTAGRMEYSPASALEALKQLGITDTDGDGILDIKISRNKTESFKLDMIINTDSSARIALFERYAQELRSLGFDALVRVLDWQSFQRALTAGEYDLYFAEARPLQNFHPSEYIQPGGAFNFSAYYNAELSEALSGLSESSGSELTYKLGTFYTLMKNESPIIPVLFKNLELYTQRGLLSSVTPVYGNIFYGFCDWKIAQ